MNERRMRTMYAVGIGLNAVALAYAVMDGSPLFAVTFGIVVVYLGLRYWMVTNA